MTKFQTLLIYGLLTAILAVAILLLNIYPVANGPTMIEALCVALGGVAKHAYGVLTSLDSDPQAVGVPPGRQGGGVTLPFMAFVCLCGVVGVICLVLFAGCTTVELNDFEAAAEVGAVVALDVALDEPDPSDRDAHHSWCHDHPDHDHCR